MYINEDELKLRYKEVYKEIVLDSSDVNMVVDSITGLGYLKNIKEDVREAKKLRTIVQLINEYRTDFPDDWTVFLDIKRREDAKIIARKKFKEQSVEGLDLLIKSYWGKNIKLKNWKSIMDVISYDEYASHFAATIVLEKELTGNWKSAFSLYGLFEDTDFLEKAGYYLVKKYNPVSFENMRMFPGETMLMNKKISNICSSELNKVNKEKALKYIELSRKSEYSE